MADFVGAIDQGTTSTRFMIFDHSGNEVGRHQLEHEQILPQAGWVEHDPIEIWERTQLGRADARLEQRGPAGLRPGRARHHQPARDDRRVEPHTGRPLYNAIVWQDTRTDRIASALDRDGRGDVIRRKAGLPPATYFSGGKIQWILENVDGAREAAENGRRDLRQHRHLAALEPHRRHRRRRARHRPDQRQPHHADGPRDAGLGRRAARVLRHPALDAAGDQAELAPGAATARRGPTVRSAARCLITGDLGDQQAATVGQVCFAPGEAKNTYGTGNFMLLNTGTELVRSQAGLLTTVCYKFGDEPPVYALEGSIAVTGSAVQWLRDQLGIISGASRERVAGPPGRGQRRRLLRAGVLRAVRAVLALRRARRDRRAVPVQHQRAPGPGHPGGHLLPEPRRRRGHGVRTPACTWRCSRSTAASPPTSCACRSRPTCSACRSAGRWSPRPPRSGAAYAAGLAVGFWKQHRRAARELERVQALGAAVERGAARGRATPSGRRPSSAPWTGWTSTRTRPHAD